MLILFFCFRVSPPRTEKCVGWVFTIGFQTADKSLQIILLCWVESLVPVGDFDVFDGIEMLGTDLSIVV